FGEGSRDDSASIHAWGRALPCTFAAMMPDEAIAYFRETVAAGDHWYVALLKTMSRWTVPEEVIDGRRYRYLIGGEAFDWLLLAERLLDGAGIECGQEERDALLFNG